MERQVVLVTNTNEEIGTAGVMKAHAGRGMLHRAVSVIVYRTGKAGPELLIQKRSGQKLLWPLSWTNTVCTHPQPGEPASVCAVRRLKEEMGITVTPDMLRFLFFLNYRAEYSDSLSEYELDAVYLVQWNGQPVLNRKEVADYAWMAFDQVVRDVQSDPEKYTPWFSLLLKRDKVRDAVSGGAV